MGRECGSGRLLEGSVLIAVREEGAEEGREGGKGGRKDGREGGIWGKSEGKQQRRKGEIVIPRADIKQKDDDEDGGRVCVCVAALLLFFSFPATSPASLVCKQATLAPRRRSGPRFLDDPRFD